MKLNLLFFSTFFYISAYCGNSNNIEKYYKYINIAEKGIVSGNLLKARKFYEKAFKLEEVYFASDIRNALKVESELEPDSSSTYWCFRNYVKTGFTGYKTITKMFEPFQKQPYWPSIKLRLDTISTDFDNYLTIALQNILDLDQSVRMDYVKQISTQLGREELNKIDSNNRLQLLNLLKSKNINEETVQSEQLFSVVNLILLHSRGKEDQLSIELFNLVKKEVLKGNFDARKYVNTFDINYCILKKESPLCEGYYGDGVCFVTDKFFLTRIPMNSKVKREINKRRKEIYLGDYMFEPDKKKVQYKSLNNGWNYFFNLSFYSMNIEDEEWFFDTLKKGNIIYKIDYK